MSALLNGESLSVSYGGVHAVIDLDLSVQPGEIAGLIGPNGAGKTSLIDGLSGFTPMSGRATFKGVDLSGRRPHQRADLGLLRTWQSVKLSTTSRCSRTFRCRPRDRPGANSRET